MRSQTAMDRRSGVALWRQIADEIRRRIGQGGLARDDRLPPEIELAGIFGVNRHTVRSAIAALVQEGVLRAEQGRGTFVERRRRLSYPIGVRTRFSAGLEGQARERRGRLIASAREPADARVASALGLAAGATVLRLESVGEADGRPVSRATSWFYSARFPHLDREFASSGSISAALAAHGVGDYFRQSTLVSARHADAADLADLALSPGAIVLVAIALNVDAETKPVQFSETRFAADRVELSVTGAV